ncbi:tetratricopeptide repeat protein [Paraburkholderia sp. GAS82]|uniref:tetratricopeptide repeat protein n=1 Tax=Paraburkholderia sp. GAS82 TaxID=3035137 RepID=UPI003D1C3993
MNSHHERTEATSSAHLDRLMDFLRADPHNVSLLGAAATAAYDAQCFDVCDELLKRHNAATGSLPPALLNLEGLSAMSQSNFEVALAAFEQLLSRENDPAVRYNAAYAAAMLGRFEHAIGLLDSRVIAAIPQATALKIRALHHLGHLQEVIALAEAHLNNPETGAEITGLLATALLDAGDIEGARRYAAMARENADSLTVRGMLTLDEANNADAMALFSEALQTRPDNVRALLGLGLALLAQERFAEAAAQMDAAAAAFKTHAGSWIAAGWAHFLNGDRIRARTRFEEAGRVDRGFAEAPGSLAVVDFAEGKLADARRHSVAALRLDRACLSAALAQSLLSNADGETDVAAAIRDAALNRPLDASGKTIAQALARRAAKMS